MKEGPRMRGMRVNCTEHWEDMTPVGRDRHCGVCDKVVIDFTTWTPAAMHAWFHAHPDTCGQFRVDQVQPGLMPLPDVQRSLLRGATAALAALSLATGMAQQQPKAPTPVEQGPSTGSSVIHGTDSLPKDPEARCWMEKEAEAPPAVARRHPRYFLSGRFPFIHRARVIRGKRLIGCPSF